jgi:hypothetical protein
MRLSWYRSGALGPRTTQHRCRGKPVARLKIQATAGEQFGAADRILSTPEEH